MMTKIEQIESLRIFKIGDITIFIVLIRNLSKLYGFSCDVIIVPDNLTNEEYASLMPMLKLEEQIKNEDKWNIHCMFSHF